jgi:hypothetical protein
MGDGMPRQPVHHHVVVGPHQAGDGAEARAPASGEERHFRHAQRLGELPLQLQRERRVAQQRGRAGAVRTEAAQGIHRGLGHGRMAGQPQVVLGGEVDAGVALAAVGEDVGGWPRLAVERAGVEPDALAAPAFLPLVETARSLVQTLAVRPLKAGDALREHREVVVRRAVGGGCTAAVTVHGVTVPLFSPGTLGRKLFNTVSCDDRKGPYNLRSKIADAVRCAHLSRLSVGFLASHRKLAARLPSHLPCGTITPLRSDLNGLY